MKYTFSTLSSNPKALHQVLVGMAGHGFQRFQACLTREYRTVTYNVLLPVVTLISCSLLKRKPRAVCSVFSSQHLIQLNIVDSRSSSPKKNNVKMFVELYSRGSYHILFVTSLHTTVWDHEVWIQGQVLVDRNHQSKSLGKFFVSFFGHL